MITKTNNGFLSMFLVVAGFIFCGIFYATISPPEINLQSNSSAIVSAEFAVFTATNIDGEVILKSHATEHGVSAEFARECLSSKNYHLFFNKSTNRYGIACFNEDVNKWAVVILEKIGQNFEEVTAFVKEKHRISAQVINYMKNAGYILINN